MTFKLHQGPVDRLVVRLIRAQAKPGIGALAKLALKWRGTDFPAETLTGSDPVIQHGGVGVVVHDRVRMGSRVTFMHGVTLGRADPWRAQSEGFGIEVGDDVFFGAGAVVLSKRRPVTIGRGTVIGANAVLTESTGEWEVWAGNPARRVSKREPAQS